MEGGKGQNFTGPRWEVAMEKSSMAGLVFTLDRLWNSWWKEEMNEV